MKRFAKYAAGAAAAALITLTAAAPAQAQYYPYPQDDGIDMSDIVRGVAIAGAAAAAIAAIRNATGGYGGYGYPSGGYGYPAGGYGYPAAGYGQYGYGVDYAVDVCAREAQRLAAGGRVSVTDVDRSGSRSYRVRGVIDASYNNRGVWNRGYERYDRYTERRTFSCKAREDGRITDFDTDRV